MSQSTENTIVQSNHTPGQFFLRAYKSGLAFVFILSWVFAIAAVSIAQMTELKLAHPEISVSRGLYYYPPTSQYLTAEQWDKANGIVCAVPEAEARNYLDNGNAKSALSVLETMTPVCKLHSRYTELKAEAEMGIGNYKEASILYRQSIGLDHDRIVNEYGDNTVMTQNFGDPVNWFRYAESLYRSGQTDYGIQVYNMVAASENQPTGYVGNNVAPNSLPILGNGATDVHPSAEILTAVTHIVEGMQAQTPDKKYSYFQEAVSLAPSLPITQFMMGQAELFHSSFAAAKPYFQQAINLADLSADPKSAGLANAVQEFSDRVDPDVLRAKWQALKDSGAFDPSK